MRIWLKPDRMAAYNISSAEVIESLQNQNIEAAPGKVGESSDKKSQSLQYVVRYTGKFNMPGQYEDVVLKSNADGKLLRLKDVADMMFCRKKMGNRLQLLCSSSDPDQMPAK
jgi:HAE1 family hydrophobic/amphiphilic exporter-1